MHVLYQGFANPKGVPSVVKDGGHIYVIKATDVQKIQIEKNIGLYKAYREDIGRAISQSIYIGFLRDLKKSIILRLINKLWKALHN